MESFTLGLMRGRAPLYRQLYRHIVEEIASGGLAAGGKATQQAAGSGPAGERFHRGNGLPNAGGGGLHSGPREKAASRYAALKAGRTRPSGSGRAAGTARKRWAYDFGTGSVDTALFPFKTWARIQRETVTAHPELLNHGSRQGDASLRAAIAKYLHAYRGGWRPSRSWWARASNIWWACWPGCSAPAPLRWKIRAIPARRRCCATTACARCSCLWTGTA